MDNIIEYYNTEVAKLKEKRLTEGQGAVRDGIGNIYQNVAQMLIESVDPTLVCKHNDYLTKYSPSGKFKVDNIQVDLHVYKDDKLIFILESKTYLDACFLKRAVEDFREIRGIVGDIPAIIWAGQNAYPTLLGTMMRSANSKHSSVIRQRNEIRRTRFIKHAIRWMKMF